MVLSLRRSKIHKAKAHNEFILHSSEGPNNSYRGLLIFLPPLALLHIDSLFFRADEYETHFVVAGRELLPCSFIKVGDLKLRGLSASRAFCSQEEYVLIY